MSRELVVVGQGMVGYRLVEQLRGFDASGTWRISALAEENRAAYDRVNLSSYLDGNNADALNMADREFFDDPLVDLRLSSPVIGIDRRGRRVHTADGDEIDYDTLVLATGSRPILPPVPGHELNGCFCYRTLDDLEAIRLAAAEGRPGVVVGGGVLGLEAANALRLLGMTPHVVEVAPGPMSSHLSEDAGRLLTRLLTSVGFEPHCGVAVESVNDDGLGNVRAVSLSDGTIVEADLVVFAAGVRPRDELADSSGLKRGERGGFLVDSRCRTEDRNVFAIGECAAVEGYCHGRVAPGYRMAEGVAEQLLGLGPGEFPGVDPGIKLKLPGVEVGAFGDAWGSVEGGLEFVRQDGATRTYAKLFLSEDGRSLLGGQLVGDTSAYSALRSWVGQELPTSPERLLRAEN